MTYILFSYPLHMYVLLVNMYFYLFLIHYCRLTLVGTDPSISILTGFVIIIALCREGGGGLALHAAVKCLAIASWLGSPLSAGR